VPSASVSERTEGGWDGDLVGAGVGVFMLDGSSYMRDGMGIWWVLVWVCSCLMAPPVQGMGIMILCSLDSSYDSV
jgi:hypothetical protein